MSSTPLKTLESTPFILALMGKSIHSVNANNFAVTGELWEEIYRYCYGVGENPDELVGLVDTETAFNENGDGMTYWAGIRSGVEKNFPGLDQRLVPAGNYAAFTHRGPIALLRNSFANLFIELAA